MEEIRFDRRVAVITGAGNGLGRTYALELARRGALVVVNDLGVSTDATGQTPAMADRVVQEITSSGGTAVASYDSVATPEGGAAIVQTALDSFGRVDIVINNAGVLRDKTFTNLTSEDIEFVLRVHLLGSFYVSQPAFKAMKSQEYGRFLFTTSAAGLFGNFGQTNYAAAKLGTIGLMNVLALEGAKYNIKANAVAPIAKTRLTAELMGRLLDLLPAEQVTPLSCYLVSEACSLSGEIFSAGGGSYARVFVGLGSGWFAGKSSQPTLEDIRDHLDEIRSERDYIVPTSVRDELKRLLTRLS